jgi:hypothetical protein
MVRTARGHAFVDFEWERTEMKRSGCSPSEIEAFELTSRREACHAPGQPDASVQLAFSALRLFPRSIDAHRLLACHLTPNLLVSSVDTLTFTEIVRESLAYVRPFHVRAIAEQPGGASRSPPLRALVRLLMAIPASPVSLERVDIAILALEEVLRLDHADLLLARESLALCYIKVIGRRHRGQLVDIERGIGDLTALLACHFPGAARPLFDRRPSTASWYNDDLMVLRWVDIFLDFQAAGPDWPRLVKEEHEICPWLFRYIFEEVSKLFKPGAAASGSLQANASRLSDKLLICLYDWPDLVLAMHGLLRKTRSRELEIQFLKLAPGTFEESTRDAKRHFSQLGYRFLERGREELAAAHYEKTFALLTIANRSFSKAMHPDQRSSLSNPFQLSSNRALVCLRSRYWNLCRHDTRMTIYLQNDHLRSYERLPRIAQEFGALRLKDQIAAFVLRLKSQKPRTQGEWRRAAQQAIAWTSMRGLMADIAGGLTAELMDELIRIGIEDMYTPLNLPADIIDPLPWLDESKLDAQ